MMFPLVRDLATTGIPVVVTCRVLGFSTQAFYRWGKSPCSPRDLADAQNDSAYAPCASLHRLEIDTLALLWEREAIEAKQAYTVEEAVAKVRSTATAKWRPTTSLKSCG